MPNNKTTRTAAGSGSIRQRPNGRWEARLTLGYDEGTGKRKTLSIYGATQKENDGKTASAGHKYFYCR